MKFFTALLYAISGLILFDKQAFIYGIAIFLIALFLTFKKFRREKKVIIFHAAIFACFLIYGLLEIKTFQSPEAIKGIVIKRSENYFVLFDGLERFYVNAYDFKDINLFDVIEINGYFAEYNFSVLESDFDFNLYLKNLGISRQLGINSYSTLFKNSINCSLINNSIISQFISEKTIELMNTLILDEIDYNSTLIKRLQNNTIFYLFSLSGIYINYFIYKLVNLLSVKFKPFLSNLLALAIVSPLLILNINSFVVLRIFVVYLFKLISIKRNDYDSLKYKSLSYLVLLINKHNLYQYGFIMPLLISTFMQFSKLLFKRRKWYIKKFVPAILIFVLVLPFSISFNNSINIVSILISIIFMPFIRIIILLFYPSIFMLKLPFIESIMGTFYDIIMFFDISAFNINMPEFNPILVIIYYFLIFIILYFREINFKKFYEIAMSGYMAFLLLYCLPIKNTFTSSVSFINVGQGDSTLIRIKNKTILVDTGGSLTKDIANDCLIPYFKKNRIYKIDEVIITHYDMDHYYALENLQNDFKVGKIYDYTNFAERDNSILTIYNINNNLLNVVDENSKSLVLRFELSDKRFLLMGDAPIEIEHEIVKKYSNLDCDILKVGHHGSETSSSVEFLKAVTPEEAIISCGLNNKYGHPNDKVLENLESLNVKVRRTDYEGTIEYIV